MKNITSSILLSLPISIGNISCTDSKPTSTQVNALGLGFDRCEEPIAIDHDPDPNVVEVHLRASATNWPLGTKEISGLAFNNCMPGPLIMAERGNILRVVFDNALEEETTIHWHGLRLPNSMDGTTAVQNPIKPGEQFVYEYELKDVGLYWYHPHMDVDAQVERGLQGAIWIQDPEAPDIDTEIVVLDDILLNSQDQIEEPTEGMMMSNMGRLGNQLIISGQIEPTILMKKGEWKLLAFVNSANTRYFDLSLDDHQMQLVGTDGGFLKSPIEIDQLVLAPGERALVLIQGTGKEGEHYSLFNHRYNFSNMGGFGMGCSGGMTGAGHDPLPSKTTVLNIAYGDETVEETTQPVFLRDNLEAFSATDPTHIWKIDMAHGGHMDFTIDGETYPDVPVVSAQVGQRTFVIENNSTMDHPFHIHGERFQVMEMDYVGWKDTFNIPAESKITIVSELENPGDWMYHCHILEHEENGMMGVFQVQP